MIEKIDNPIICIREVNENIRRVETDQPLTRSLSVLNANCEFRKKYEEMDMIINPVFKCPRCGREIRKKGYCSKECKGKHREYYKEYNRRYYQRPEIRTRKREYNRIKNNIPKERWRIKDETQIIERR